MVFSFCALVYFLPISIALVESFSGLIIFFYLIKKISAAVFEVRELKSASKKISFLNQLKVVIKNLLPTANFFNKPILIFLAFILISVIKSQVPELSVRAFINKILEQCLLFSSFIECMKTKKQIYRFLCFYFLSALVVGLSGFVQYATGQDFLRGNEIADGRISSSLRHANDLGAYILITYPIFLLLGLQSWKKDLLFNGNSYAKDQEPFYLLPKVSTGLLAVLLIALGLTFSRGSWIGFFVGILLLIWKYTEIRTVVTVVFVTFLIVFTPLLAQKRNVSFLSDDLKTQKMILDQLKQSVAAKETSEQPQGSISSTDNFDNLAHKSTTEHQSSNTSSLSLFKNFKIYSEELYDLYIKSFGGMGRTGFWAEAVKIIKDYPYFGAGLNTYSRVIHQYKINWGGYPHNCFLQMAAEIGLLGLGSFLFMIFILFKRSIQFFASCKDFFVKAVLLGAVTGLLGFLIQSTFDTTLYSLQLSNLMWIMMGLIVAVQIMPQEKATYSSS